MVEAVQCAVAVQRTLLEDDGPIKLRIGINLGDVIADGDDVYGDGVNVAARLEAIAAAGGICISDMVYQNIHSKLDESFEAMGEQILKNIGRPVTAWRWVPDPEASAMADGKSDAPSSERPSIAVLPFNNMSGDPEQEYFSDGITEDIITELRRFRELFVSARNSSFSSKGKQMKVHDIGRDLGVAYIVEGSYMNRDYERAIALYMRRKNPPRHMHLLLALCHAQHGNTEAAARAFALHVEKCPDGYDDRPFVKWHVGMCKRPEDAEHWLEGYRKVGLPV